MRRIVVLASSLLLAGFDQATKLAAEIFLADLPPGQAVRVIGGVLYLKPTQNPGGMWGILDRGPTWVFIALSLFFVAFLVCLIYRLVERDAAYLPPLALLLGGFIGNGIDRVRVGYVTDFIYFTGYPAWLISTFNVADLAILLGLGWLAGRFVYEGAVGIRRREASP